MFDLCCGPMKTGISSEYYGTGDASERASGWRSVQGNLQFGFSCWAAGKWRSRAGGIGYTVEMNSDAIERIETKIAFLESANVELSDVVYRQQQEIAALRARLDALTQRIEAAQTPDTLRAPEEERPPHY
jgi:SlyX protein